MAERKYDDHIKDHVDNYKSLLTQPLLKDVISNEDVEYLVSLEKRNVDKLLNAQDKIELFQKDLQHIKDKHSDMYSLTEIARKKNEKSPSYEIQSWLRNENTLSFLCFWEEENNVYFKQVEAMQLIEKTREPSFTITAKKWIEKTKARGIKSKQGNGGGTLAYHEIAIDFACWLFPEKRYEMSKMIRKNLLINES